MTQPRPQSDTAAEHATDREAETPAHAEAATPQVNEKLARFLELLDGEMSDQSEAQIEAGG